MVLERLREVSQGTIAKILLGLITIPFALFGLDYYFKSGPGDALATVAGHAISQQHFQQELRTKLQELKTALGDRGPDVNTLNTPQYREAVLDQLINTALVESASQKAGVTVPDSWVVDKIKGMEPFKESGQFSDKRYETVLKMQGFTVAQFEKDVRHDMVLQAYQEGMMNAGVMPKVAQTAWVKLANQSREVSVAEMGLEAFSKDITIDEAKLRQWYDSHVASYQTPERVEFQYVVLTPESLGRDLSVSPEEVRAAYEARNQKIQGQEERRASHILIAVKSSASEADKKAARTKAEGILKDLEAHPDQFAALAEKFSQDPGSAKQGGDLGFFPKGTMLKPFEDAAFSMKEGQTSKLVQTDFGYHIIRLTGIRGMKGESLKDATPALTQELKTQKAQKAFAEASDSFSNLVFEQSGSLKPVADALKLTVRDGGTVSRNGSGLPKELQNAKFLDALFSSEVVKDKRNTAAIDLGQQTLVAARATRYEAAQARPFADVKGDIEATLKREEALKLAKKAGEEALAQLKAGKELSLKFGKATLVTRQAAAGALPRELVDPAFRVNADHLPAYAGAEVPGRGYVIARVSRLESKADEEASQNQAEAILRETAQKETFVALVGSLRKNASISINRDMLNAFGRRPD